MKQWIKTLGCCGALALVITGCSTTVNPYTGQRQTSKASQGMAIGAIGGAVLGGIVGGNSGSAFGGALAGGVAGTLIGNSMDQEDAQLRQNLQNSNVQYHRSDRGLQMVLPADLFFGKNSANIKSHYFHRLNGMANVLRHHRHNLIMISGYTDNRGSPKRNQMLSQERADSVATYLSSQGIPRGRIITRGYGELYPVASNSSAHGRKQNRRVEITLRPMGRR